MLESVEIEPREQVKSSMIWLHGLGADGHDFEPVVTRMELPFTRFILPHAPVRPVTVNGGVVMRAWYDAFPPSMPPRQDLEGMSESENRVKELIKRENERGVPSSRIVLAGFSQGGVIALMTGFGYPQQLAGIVALSTGLPAMDELMRRMMSGVNRTTPLFVANGTREPSLPEPMRQQIVGQLTAMGCSVIWNTYDMGHSVCPREINDLRSWLTDLSVMDQGY